MNKLKKYAIATGLAAAIAVGGWLGYSYYKKSPEPVQETPAELVHSSLEEKVNTIDIASFNIQVFGESKRSKPEVVDILKKTASNFDIIALQELKDSDNEGLNYFVGEMREHSHKDYRAISSPPLGRSSSKEKFAFIYDANKIQWLGREKVYSDKNNNFERPPYIASFKAGKFGFVLVNTHTKPSEAKKEIMALEDVVEQADKDFNERDVIVLGDFNADGSYFSESINYGLRDARFDWIITDDMDTTLAKSNNTYDRIVIRKKYTSEDFTGQKQVFRFDQVYCLPLLQAKRVSDHYPVEAKFYTDKDTD